MGSSIWHFLKNAAHFTVLLSNLSVLWLLFFDVLILVESCILEDPISVSPVIYPSKECTLSSYTVGLKIRK